MTRAYVGLGSNLGDREEMLKRALDELDRLPGTRVWKVSRFLETDPVGVEDQPKFINAVAMVETSLSPRQLLDAMLGVERMLGRRREDSERWGPREIDLDLLLYGNERIKEPGLRVPHPRIHERLFVLEGLWELDDELTIPGQGWLRGLRAAKRAGIQ